MLEGSLNPAGSKNQVLETSLNHTDPWPTKYKVKPSSPRGWHLEESSQLWDGKLSKLSHPNHHCGFGHFFCCEKLEAFIPVASREKSNVLWNLKADLYIFVLYIYILYIHPHPNYRSGVGGCHFVKDPKPTKWLFFHSKAANFGQTLSTFFWPKKAEPFCRENSW